MGLANVRHAFVTLVWPRRRLLFVGLFLIIVNRLAGLVLPGATKVLIDDVIGKGDRGLLRLLLLAVGGAVTVQAVTSFLLTRLLSVQAHGLIRDLRVRVQEQVLRLPLRYFDDTQTGAVVSRVMNDVEGVRNLIGTGLVQLIGGMLTAVVAGALLVRLDPLLTLAALAPLSLFGLVSLRAFGLIRPIFRERGAIQAEVTGRLTETFGGIRVVRGFHAEAAERRVFRDGVERLFQNVKRSLTATSLVTSSATLLMGITSVIIMAAGASRILGGAMTVGDFFAFTLYLGFLVSPIVQMSNIGTQITEAFAGLDRMDEILSMEREGEEEARTEVLEEIAGEIRFEGVSFGYEPGVDVLQSVDFVAPAGSVTALVGSSGSGKTTLASLAASFLRPREGVITVDGRDLSTVKLESYRRHLGVVLQDEFLFEGTIRENILFARVDADEDALQKAVHAAHVHEFTDRFEKGLETVIGERGVKLSGGQRQRVAIARALIADPRILILDEATSSLDTESESFIQDSLSRLLQGRTTFVIAHRLSTIRRADQILVIEGGKIVERGTHTELVAAEGRYHQLYTYQTRI